MPRVVSDTGPLLALAHLQQLDLLRHLFGEVILAPAVRAEVTDDVSQAALSAAHWVSVHAPRDRLAVQLLSDELDPGECETLILAKELDADLELIDERAATRRGRALGLQVMGTLGVLLLGKQGGHLAALRPLLDQLRLGGFHMSTELYELVLQTANEA